MINENSGLGTYDNNPKNDNVRDLKLYKANKLIDKLESKKN